jgi:hypothetical protein
MLRKFIVVKYSNNVVILRLYHVHNIAQLSILGFVHESKNIQGSILALHHG